MTNSEINSFYVEIEKLLNDICKFLHVEMLEGYISQNGRNFAKSLIERSKKQLQVLAMNATLETTESYVDMQAYKVNQNQNYPDSNEVYSDVSLTYEPTSGISIIEDDDHTCPYANLPASQLRDGKCGDLYRKEKILFFEQQKKVFGAIQHTWFLVYTNEHALKPSQTFDLSRYEVRPSCLPLKDTKKREESFDLVCSTDTKSHQQFTAHTPKDMQQWVAALKQQIDTIVFKRSLPPVPTNPSDDFVRISADLNDDYEPLKNYMVTETKEWHNSTEDLQKKTVEEPLPLPPRNQTKNSSKYIPRVPSDDSLSSNYDSVTAGFLLPSRESSNSFSEDDSDTHYDDPSEIRNMQKPQIVPKNEGCDENDDEDEVYDYLEKFNSPESKKTVKPPPQEAVHSPSPQLPTKVQIKPTPSLKPKLILNFRQRKKN